MYLMCQWAVYIRSTREHSSVASKDKGEGLSNRSTEEVLKHTTNIIVFKGSGVYRISNESSLLNNPWHLLLLTLSILSLIP